MYMSKKKKGTGSTIVTVVVVAVILVLLVGYFYRELNSDKSNDDGKRTEIEKLLDKNFDTSYPATEREVVKVYCRIQKAMYSGNCSDDNVQALFAQMRKLYDDELISANSYDEQYKKLKEELESYKKDKKKIVNYSVEDADNVQKGEYKGSEQALVDVVISMKQDSDWERVGEQFVLRKDEDGRWKILGWYQTSLNDENKDSEE